MKPSGLRYSLAYTIAKRRRVPCGAWPLTPNVWRPRRGPRLVRGKRHARRHESESSHVRRAHGTSHDTRAPRHPPRRTPTPTPHRAHALLARAGESFSQSQSSACASTRHARSGVARRADQTGRQTRNGPLSLTLCHSLRLVPDLRSSPHCAPCIVHGAPVATGSGSWHCPHPSAHSVTAPHTVTGRASVTVFLPQSSVTVRLL